MEYKFITKNDTLYPEKLKQIKKSPKKLYYEGNIELLNKEMIAIIGTRNITKYGIRMAKKFGREIAKRNIPIISGMALGTDTIAHEMALELGCPTIAVLGTGLDDIYPKENLELYSNIVNSGGLIVTEIEPGKEFNNMNFPKRNRIISGLAEGVLVIEAGYRSGTSITVNYAKEQNKKVFAIPGTLDNVYGVGVNKFIKEGAILVTEIADILEHYPQFANELGITFSENNGLKPNYQEIYKLVSEDNNTIDEIAQKLPNKSVSEIRSILTILELQGFIKQDIGNGYKINM